jgi:hypothetical protein
MFAETKAFEYGSDADIAFWQQCRSEGGNMNCARCKVAGQDGPGSGVLDCASLKAVNKNWKKNEDEGLDFGTTGWDNPNFPATKKRWKGDPSLCPDDLSALAGWSPHGGNNKGYCRPLFAKLNEGTKCDTYNKKCKGNTCLLPGADKTFSGPHMSTKITTVHPEGAARNIGAIMMKRTVSHPSTTLHNGTRRMLADVHKVGICIKCPTDVFPSINSSDDVDADMAGHVAFATQCLIHAIEQGSTGIRSSYKCDEKDSDGTDNADFRRYTATLLGY